MNLNALAPWFGGKRNLAPWIVETLGPHRVYWEPFCGSMSVLLAKPPCVMETANDLHGDLVNLARVIQHPQMGPALYRKLRRVLFTEEQFHEARAVLVRSDASFEVGDIDRAFRYFLVSWCGRNGVAGTRVGNSGFSVRYTANGGHAAKRWRSAVDSIPSWRRRLQNVTILRRDGLELLDRIDDAPGTAIYCDPPYLVKGSKYLHDFNSSDHARLATALARFRRARVVVSYYEHPELARLYPGWSQRTAVVTKSLVSEGRRDRGNEVKATEVLLVNSEDGLYPSPIAAEPTP